MRNGVAAGRCEQPRPEAAEPGGDDDCAEYRDERKAVSEPRVEKQAQADGGRERGERDEIPDISPSAYEGKIVLKADQRVLVIAASTTTSGRKLAPWRTSSCCTSLVGTSLTGMFSFAACAAHTPAAWPVAMTIGMTR